MSVEKYVHGRRAGVKTDEGKMVRNGTPKLVPDKGARNSGAQPELAEAAGSLYSKCVKNGGGTSHGADTAIKTR